MNPESIESNSAVRARALIVAISLAFGIFYLLLGSDNYIYADDSLRFALYIETEPTILVHHLIIAILFYAGEALNPFPEGIDGTIEFIRIYVAATSVLALTMVGILTLRWFGSIGAAILALCGVAVSYGFWSYSIITDFYVPAVAFVLAAIYFADRSYREHRPLNMLLLAAFSLLLASLNHQSHALAVVPVALVLFYSGRAATPLPVRRSRALVFLGATALLGLGSFYAAFLFSGAPDFIRFVRGYSAYFMMTPYDRLQPLTPVYTLIGILRTLVFPEIVLGIDSIFAAVHQRFPLKVLIDDRYLIRAFPPLLLGGVTIMMTAFLALLSVGVVRAFGLVRRHTIPHPGYWMVVLWTLAQTMLFFWWEPISNEFWIWMMPALALLISGPLFVHGSPLSRRLQVVVVGLLFLANLPVISRYWSSENCIYWINKSYAQAIGPNDLILTANFYQTSSMDRVRIPSAERYDLLGGAFIEGELRLHRALEKVRAGSGSVFLDPMLAMPEATEMAMRKYYTKRNPALAGEELQQLELYCRENGIPIYAIERIGDPGGMFQRRKFNGYLRWIPADADRASLGRIPAPSDRTTQ